MVAGKAGMRYNWGMPFDIDYQRHMNMLGLTIAINKATREKCKALVEYFGIPFSIDTVMRCAYEVERAIDFPASEVLDSTVFWVRLLNLKEDCVFPQPLPITNDVKRANERVGKYFSERGIIDGGGGHER
jgi:hypothetical protein